MSYLFVELWFAAFHHRQKRGKRWFSLNITCFGFFPVSYEWSEMYKLPDLNLPQHTWKIYFMSLKLFEWRKNGIFRCWIQC